MHTMDFTWEDEDNLREVELEVEYTPIPYRPAWGGSRGEPPLNPPEGGYCEIEGVTAVAVRQWDEDGNLAVVTDLVKRTITVEKYEGVNTPKTVLSTHQIDETAAKMIAANVEGDFAKRFDDEVLGEKCQDHYDGVRDWEAGSREDYYDAKRERR
jgi:hypothetical protein